VIVVWGGNRLIDCVSLLSWKDRTILSVSTSPVLVHLTVPPDGTNGLKPLKIEANELISSTPPPREVDIRISPTGVAILWTQLPIVTVLDIGLDRPSGHRMVLLRTDLRPLGINVFDDAAGIHVGEGLVARTAFSRCSTAIVLR
jgi:hypothetical protein